ncbi:MAG: DUF4830 domain-containing protein [Clostridia bacterium]|nr:DUF4830 domain-containing protein [Clostridia bacterium]
MNIYTFKLTKKVLVAAVLAVAALIALLILALPGEEAAETGASVSIKTSEDCVQYLTQLGYQLDAASCRAKKVLIPKEFDAVYESYNEMQKECGFDLSKYAGKRAELTTWAVTNWPGGEEVLVDVLVYKNKVIGGAVYTASVEGFMYGLRPMEAQPKD